ncbi:oxidoreductase [Tabrizicola sp. TH137]|uniref:FAD-dependent oxidoreductase n=1 Tax=Tabrizicola sp. TH137 TaxID=2067452 RepID=UPI000C79CBBE|nr:FAD-dependent oxidoreductase [Tabrizicola sp. TH137]PLL11264.1 oxidoreductase [Tabrizicola sp. TH137]
MQTLPSHARIVIIGGGAIGTSIAYHLGKLGVSDVVLLERDKLTSGTTWHAAGLIASGGMSTETLIWIEQYTRQLYIDLPAETGLSTGWRQCGHIHLACDADRHEVLRRDANFVRSQGVERFELSPAEIKAKFPLIETAGIVSGFYTPSDGRANPVDATMSMAAGARARGVRFFEGTPVTDFVMNGTRVTGVVTLRGTILADQVVLATGMWSRQIAARIGVRVPLQAAEHYYLLTEPIAGMHPDMPVVEDPTTYTYVREEGGGMLFGLFEPEGAAWNLNGIPQDASFSVLPPDWDRMTPFLEAAFERYPVMKTAGIKTFFCGPESFTPDGSYLLGEAPEVDGLFLATGLNSLGILSAGGVGSILAELLTTGTSTQDITGLDIARTRPHQATRHYLGARIPKSLGYTFTFGPLPHWHHKTARGMRRLALHDRYAAMGAYLHDLSGWEMPYWFSPDAPPPKVDYASHARQAWHDLSAREHHATRTAAGLFDKSFMGKFLVQGRDALAVLNRVSANNVDVPLGTNVYTQWLNHQGGIISDLTITRTGEAEFLLVTGDILQSMTPAWLRRQTRADEAVTVSDVTSAFTILSLQGPKSRDILQAMTGEDLSNAALPFRASRFIDIGPVPLRIVRVTYMGELGYELYIPTEYSHAAHDALIAGMRAAGVEPVHCGMMALESLRLEKGYRDFAVDIDNTDTPLQAGLGFVVDFSKPDFIGRDALLRQKAAGPLTRRVVQFLLQDPEPLLFGNEPILCDGKDAGYIRAGAFGPTLGASVGLGLVTHDDGITADMLRSHRWEVEVNDRRIPATPSLAPFFDPKGERVRA